MMYVRRLTLVLTLAAAALPAVSRAQAGAGPRPAGGVLLGLETADGNSGIALRLDAAFPLRPLGPSVGLAVVGSIGYARVSDEVIIPFDRRWTTTDDIFRIAPAVRFTFGNSPSLRPYADAGLGIYLLSEHVNVYDHPSGVLLATSSASDSGLFLRLAAGLMVQVSQTMSLGAEVGVNPASGHLANTFHAMAALQMRL